MEDSKKLLQIILKDKPKRRIILILNKQDLKGAINEREFLDILEIEKLEIEYLIFITSIVTSEGVQNVLVAISFAGGYLKIKKGSNIQNHLYFSFQIKSFVKIFLLVLKRTKFKIRNFFCIHIVNFFIDLNQIEFLKKKKNN